MDENVVFNPKKTGESEEKSPPSQEQAQEPVAADQSVVQDPAAVQEPSTGEQPPPEPPAQTPPVSPGGIAGFLGGSMKKKIIVGVVILIILLVLLVLFIPRDTAPKKVTLQWWGLWEDSSTMQGIISDFEKQYPHLTVEYTKQEPEEYRKRLEARIQNGTGPDIFRYHNSWLPMMLQSDLLTALPSEVISADEFQKNYYPVMQSDLVNNSGLYGLPLGADTLALFVNTELFESAGVAVPQNWDDFVKVSQELTVKDPETKKIKTAGAALGTYGNVTHSSDIIALLFAQQGVSATSVDTPKQEADALDFYTSFAQGSNNVWDNTLDESVLAFARGNLAMYFGYSWDVFTIRKINENLSFEVFPVPGLFGKNTTIASYWVEGVSSQSTHKQEAFLFMNYLSQKETLQKLYADETRVRGFGEPYARVDLAPTLQDNKLIYPFVSQLPTATSTYFSSNTQDGEGGINTLMNGYLENAVNAIIIDHSSTQTVVETLDQGVVQTFTQYGIQ